MCKFQITESKANAHAGMPFCGMLQFVMPTFLVGLWSYRPRATARLGRGSFVFIVLGNAEPRLGKCNDLRLFCIHTKYGEVLCGTGVNSIGVNDGAFNEF